MGCSISTYKDKSKDYLDSSGPLHIDKNLQEHGLKAPLLDKLAYTSQVYVVSVYDGDTFTIATYNYMNTEKQIVRIKCRMLGIDTPEMKPPKNQPDRIDEIAKAKESKTIC